MGSLFGNEGPLYRALEYVSTLFLLNLITMLMCIPVITAGAAITAMHYVLMQLVEGSEGHVFKTFWKQFRANFKTSTPSWLLLLVSGLFFYWDCRLVMNHANGLPAAFVVAPAIGLFIVYGMILWIFPYLARFEARTGMALKNALLLFAGSFPRTIGMMAITAAIPFLFVRFPRLLPLLFGFGLSLPGCLDAFLYAPVIAHLADNT